MKTKGKIKWFFFIVVLFFSLTAAVPVQAKETEEEQYKEEIKREISKREGYDEKEERSWRILPVECEPGGGLSYFVASYTKNVRELSWDKFTTYHGDVWAVKNDVYTKLFDDVELDGSTSGGLDWYEMDGRTFVLIHTKIGEGRNYEPDECYLYSYCGEEPVCFIDDFMEVRFNREKEILTLYFVSPIRTYEVGRLNMWNPYGDAAYFFTCENGELKELEGEPCTEEEFRKNAIDAEDAIEKPWANGSNSPKMERTYYRIPEVGYYINMFYIYEDCDWEGEDRVEFSHVACYDAAFHTQEFVFTGPYGYRYCSWLNRREEEKELCQKVFDRTGEDITILLANQEGYEEATYAPDVSCVVVTPGDSLSMMFRNYTDVTWKSVYELNRELIGDDPNLIYPGMVLRIK